MDCPVVLDASQLDPSAVLSRPAITGVHRDGSPQPAPPARFFGVAYSKMGRFQAVAQAGQFLPTTRCDIHMDFDNNMVDTF